MFDGLLKKPLDPVLMRLGKWLLARGISANMMTLAGLAIGIMAAVLICFQAYVWAIPVLLLSRLADGLDGAIARNGRPSDFGGLLDIVCDFFFYGLIAVAFIFFSPVENALAGAVILLAFFVNGTSFLAYAAIAARRGQETQIRGVKSIYFTTGLAEASETLIVFILWCLWPAGFSVVAYIFTVIVFYTALSRVWLAWKRFGK